MIHHLEFENKEIILLGTAHISRESTQLVADDIAQDRPDTVCVELCQSRYQSIRQKERWQNTDIIKVIREKKSFLLLSNLLLASFQKRIARKLNIETRVEVREAHSLYIEILAETGLVGAAAVTVLFGTLLLGLARVRDKMRKHNRFRDWIPWLASIQISITAYLVSSLFLHGDALHLLGNLLYLWIFGNNMEDALGPLRFGVFYLLAGLGGHAAHLGVNWGSPVPTIKISSNTAVYESKPHWIDYNAGAVRYDTGEMGDLEADLFDLLLDVASGRTQTNNERNDFRDIAIWKTGVTL